MTISLTLNGSASEVLHDLEVLLKRGAPANGNRDAVAEAAALLPTAPTAEVIPPTPKSTEPKKTRQKVSAAEAVVEQPKPADVEDVTGKTEPPGDAKGITIDEAREKMKQFANDGHMEQVSQALTDLGVKKVSDVDPDANGKPSAKFAEFITIIEEAVAEKGAA